MQGLIGQGCRAALAALTALLIWTAPASAEPWRPVFDACMSFTGDGGACKPIRSGDGVWQIAVSPDGRYAYGSAYSLHTVVILERNPVTGALSQRFTGGCLSETGSDGQCVKVKGVTNPTGIVVSQDGRNLYVASGRGGVAVFDRDPATGDLSQRGDAFACLSQDTTTGAAPDVVGACAKGRAMSGLTTLLMSPSGREVYATGTNSFVTLIRDTSSGLLAQPDGVYGCIYEGGGEGCAPGRGLSGGHQMTITPDGLSLYLANQGKHGIVLLDRDPAFGLVRQKEGPAGCLVGVDLAGACAVEPKLRGPLGTLSSPDGRQIYVSNADGVLGFARLADGRLALQSCVTDLGAGGCSRGRNLKDMAFSAISPDGQTLVVNNYTEGSGFSVFQRAGDGTITQIDGPDACVSSTGAALLPTGPTAGGCFRVGTQRGHGQIVFTDDNSFMVASHFGRGSVTVFKRDFYPQCNSQSVTVTQNLATALPLACGDRNGDPMSYNLAKDPTAGAVGAVDQSNARVFYNPFSGYIGADSVRYQATAAGLTSNEAKLDINVVPPPMPPPPTRKPRMVNAAVSYNWSVKRTRHTITRLIVRKLPVGSTVTLRCSGKRCPLKSLTIKRSRKSTMNALNAKALSGKNKKRTRFRSGQSVDVRIAAPGMNTKMLRFVLRTGVVAKHRSYCVPLGAKRAVRGSCP